MKACSDAKWCAPFEYYTSRRCNLSDANRRTGKVIAKPNIDLYVKVY